MIVSLQMALHQKVNEAFDQIWLATCTHMSRHSHNLLHHHCSILRDVQAQLSHDLSDKNEALGIDTECAELCNSSTTITFHSDPTRIKKG